MWITVTSNAAYLHASTWKSCAWIKHDGLCSMWAVGHLPLVQCSYWIRSIIKETYNTRFALLIMQAIFCKVLNPEHLNSPFHFFSLNCELQFFFPSMKISLYIKPLKKSILQSMAYERMSTWLFGAACHLAVTILPSTYHSDWHESNPWTSYHIRCIPKASKKNPNMSRH